MKKQFSILVTVMLCVLLLSACSSKTEPPTPPAPSSSTASVESASSAEPAKPSEPSSASSEASNSAEPIKLPEASTVTSVEIAGGVEDIIITDAAQIQAFLKKAGEATPTSKKSAQDVPAVPVYTRVDLVCGSELSSLFLYEEESKWYLEQPKLGVYETDATILGLLKKTA